MLKHQLKMKLIKKKRKFLSWNELNALMHGSYSLKKYARVQINRNIKETVIDKR